MKLWDILFFTHGNSVLDKLSQVVEFYYGGRRLPGSRSLVAGRFEEKVSYFAPKMFGQYLS